MKHGGYRRQHVEQGEPDCRTCEWFYTEKETGYRCVEIDRDRKCINFSQYKPDTSFKQLTQREVTK